MECAAVAFYHNGVLCAAHNTLQFVGMCVCPPTDFINFDDGMVAMRALTSLFSERTAF